MVSFTCVTKDDNLRQNGLVKISFAENVYSIMTFCYSSIHAHKLNIYVQF